MVKIGNIELGDFPLLLAPMEDVSDPPFRMVCKENGADMMYTEFISSEGLIRNASKSIHKLDIYDEERPIGIRLPDHVTLAIAEADPVVKGQTAASSYKPAILENGVRILVPPFVSSGERVVVDTNELTYLRRAD